METISGRTIEGESLQIDDKTFVDCTFINCILEYSGQPVVFERTHLSNCRYIFYGRARSTVHFLQGVGLMSNEECEWGELSSIIH